VKGDVPCRCTQNDLHGKRRGLVCATKQMRDRARGHGRCVLPDCGQRVGWEPGRGHVIKPDYGDIVRHLQSEPVAQRVQDDERHVVIGHKDRVRPRRPTEHFKRGPVGLIGIKVSHLPGVEREPRFL